MKTGELVYSAVEEMTSLPEIAEYPSLTDFTDISIYIWVRNKHGIRLDLDDIDKAMQNMGTEVLKHYSRDGRRLNPSVHPRGQ